MQPAIFGIIDTCNIEGNDLVHHRTTISAAKLKELILKRFGDAFTKSDVDAFLQYFNKVLRSTRKDPTIDIYKHAVTLGTRDMRKR
jgi:hypothetical protein